ncbi:DUF4013 domain-containing protein [bacterium]|nr:DUF4013 domain-containing protein [bacterium]
MLPPEVKLIQPPPEATLVPEKPGLVRRVVSWAFDKATLLFGFATLVLILASVAAIPVVQLVSLGYLLEAEGRVARTGRFRDALPELRLCARIGGAAIGLLLVFLPPLVLRDFWSDAWIIDPTSRVTSGLRTATSIFAGAALLQATFALARGGRFSFFFRPFSNLGWARARLREGISFEKIRSSVFGFVDSLDVPHHFGLGLRGFVAAVLWIAIPCLIMASGIPQPGRGQWRPGVVVLGGALLALALIPLPLLQARLAAEQRFRAGFELGAVWRRFRRAPITALLALLVTLALALPLYFFKVELIPRDALWLPAVLFVLAVLPGKLVAGKAYARGSREGRAFLPLRFVSSLLALPIAGAYVGLLVFYQFIDWSGSSGLLAQHAFPVPSAFY